MRRFLIILLSAVGACAAIIMLVKHNTNLLFNFESFTWLSLAFLSVVTFAAYMLLNRAVGMKSQAHFTSFFGAALAIKVFLSLLFLCYFIYVEPIGDKHFIFPFFIMYFLFTGVLMTQFYTPRNRK
jgi:drug/metabolite transporter (DMT)-like permease